MLSIVDSKKTQIFNEKISVIKFLKAKLNKNLTAMGCQACKTPIHM